MYLHRNPSIRPTAAASLRDGVRLLLCGALLAGATATAQQLVPSQPVAAAEDPGYFQVVDAAVELDGGVFFLNAAIDYHLSSDARAALESGVLLSFRIDVEVFDPRRLWFDNVHAALRQLYQLEYHALSERYIVLNVNSGDQASFASLGAALTYLGRVDKLPLIDAALLEDPEEYDVRLRAVLDVEQFPGPLRLLAFWRRDWSLASDWYRWPLLND